MHCLTAEANKEESNRIVDQHFSRQWFFPAYLFSFTIHYLQFDRVSSILGWEFKSITIYKKKRFMKLFRQFTFLARFILFYTDINCDIYMNLLKYS